MLDTEHPINSLLKESLDNIKELSGIDTIVGEAIALSEFTKAIPISKVKLTFASGGSDIKSDHEMPFGGGAGGSVTITPVAFLVFSNGNTSVIHLESESHLIDSLIDSAPKIIDEVKSFIGRKDVIN